MNQPFHCSKCMKSSKMKSYLKDHEIIEMIDCIQCTKSAKKLKPEKVLSQNISQCENFDRSDSEESKSARPFLCIKCNKAFKLKGHLKKHEKICKGFLDYIKCSNCENVFKSEKTLRQHKVKCKAEQNYECKECESYFKSYSKFSEHREKNHKKVVCDLCGKDIHFKNIRRHMKTVHDGQTPAKYAYDLKQKHEIKMNKYKCDQCLKQFFDKSTMNRHKKRHMHKCDQCEHNFQSKQHLDDHKVTHMSAKQTRSVVITAGQLKLILEVHKHLETFMQLAANRGQEMAFVDIIQHLERTLKKQIDEDILVATISVDEKAYKTYTDNRTIFLQLAVEGRAVHGPVTPKILEERRTKFKEHIVEDHQSEELTIDLISLPKVEKKQYVSARETITKNIVKFSDDLEEDEDEKLFNTKYEEIEHKIKKRMAKKNKRDEKMNNIDWQRKRLPDVARALHNVYVTENKRVIELEKLVERLEPRYKLRSDIQRLIDGSDGWLKNFRGWIRKRPDDINLVCKKLM